MVATLMKGIEDYKENEKFLMYKLIKGRMKNYCLNLFLRRQELF